MDEKIDHVPMQPYLWGGLCATCTSLGLYRELAAMLMMQSEFLSN